MIARDPCRQLNKEFLIETISILQCSIFFKISMTQEKTFQRLRYNLEKDWQNKKLNIFKSFLNICIMYNYFQIFSS